MARLEFFGQSMTDGDNRAANSSRLINFYREPVGTGGRTGYVLRAVPGLKTTFESNAVFARTIERVKEKIYAVISGKLYVIDGSASEEIGDIQDDINTSIVGASNASETNLAISANGEYYVYDGTSLTVPTTGAFSSVGSVTFGGGYTVVTEKNGERFNWSAVGDPTSFDALHFASTEGRDDILVRGTFVNGNLWLFSQRSIEVWYNTGAGLVDAFKLLAGSVIGVGLKSFNLLGTFEAGAFFVGNDNCVYLTSGAGFVKISTPVVETELQNGDATHCYYYEFKGHKFCTVVFSDRPAWFYDLLTQEWFERAEGADNSPWSVVDTARGMDGWYGITSLGRLGSFEKLSDSGEVIHRTAISRTLENDGIRFRVPRLEFRTRVGASDLGRDAKAMVSVSKDNGLTFGLEREVSLGDQGAYAKRPVLRSLGQFRQMTAKVEISDSADIPLYADAIVDVA